MDSEPAFFPPKSEEVKRVQFRNKRKTDKLGAKSAVHYLTNGMVVTIFDSSTLGCYVEIFDPAYGSEKVVILCKEQ